MGERETLAYSSSTFLGAINGLARLQDEIAEELKDFGVIRGERGSEARHTTQQEWAANVARKDRELKHQAQEQLAKEIEFVDREDRLADREAHARETQEAAEKKRLQRSNGRPRLTRHRQMQRLRGAPLSRQKPKLK